MMIRWLVLLVLVGYRLQVSVPIDFKLKEAAEVTDRQSGTLAQNG
jgi:hypothetical protein